MNKDDIVVAVASKARITKKDAAAAVDAVFDSMLDALASGDSVKVAGFGAFEVKTHIARVGMNPITKEPIQIPEMQAIAFRAGKAAKEKVNKK